MNHQSPTTTQSSSSWSVPTSVMFAFKVLIIVHYSWVLNTMGDTYILDFSPTPPPVVEIINACRREPIENFFLADQKDFFLQ